MKLLCNFIVVASIATVVMASSAFGQSSLAKIGRPPAAVKIAITVDDLPQHGEVPPGTSRTEIARKVIAGLKNNGVPQPYGFANGYFTQYARDQVQILKEWLLSGYPLGNHTYDHLHLDDVSAQVYIANIEKMDDLLATLAPVSPLIGKRRTFRYPYLEEGNTHEKREAVRSYLARNGYRIAEVTLDYHDWAWTNAYTRCMAQKDEKSIAWLKAHVVDSAKDHLAASRELSQLLFGRDVVHVLLMHLGAFDAVALDAVLKSLRAQGAEFVTLDEALKDPVYRIDPKEADRNEHSFLGRIAQDHGIDGYAILDRSYTVERLNQVCPDKPAPN